MTTKNKPVHIPAPAESESDFDEGKFGWVWMEVTGAICNICRQFQPQSKADCIEGHPRSSMRPGIPIPWQLGK